MRVRLARIGEPRASMPGLLTQFAVSAGQILAKPGESLAVDQAVVIFS